MHGALKTVVHIMLYMHTCVVVCIGMQLGFFLQRSGKEYVIFERNTTAGEQFELLNVYIPVKSPACGSVQRCSL